jgi:hypothetical protein
VTTIAQALTMATGRTNLVALYGYCSVRTLVMTASILCPHVLHAYLAVSPLTSQAASTRLRMCAPFAALRVGGNGRHRTSRGRRTKRTERVRDGSVGSARSVSTQQYGAVYRSCVRHSSTELPRLKRWSKAWWQRRAKVGLQQGKPNVAAYRLTF